MAKCRTPSSPMAQSKMRNIRMSIENPGRLEKVVPNGSALQRFNEFSTGLLVNASARYLAPISLMSISRNERGDSDQNEHQRPKRKARGDGEMRTRVTDSRGSTPQATSCLSVRAQCAWTRRHRLCTLDGIAMSTRNLRTETKNKRVHAN